MPNMHDVKTPGLPEALLLIGGREGSARRIFGPPLEDVLERHNGLAGSREAELATMGGLVRHNVGALAGLWQPIELGIEHLSLHLVFELLEASLDALVDVAVAYEQRLGLLHHDGFGQRLLRTLPGLDHLDHRVRERTAFVCEAQVLAAPAKRLAWWPADHYVHWWQNLCHNVVDVCVELLRLPRGRDEGPQVRQNLDGELQGVRDVRLRQGDARRFDPAEERAEPQSLVAVFAASGEALVAFVFAAVFAAFGVALVAAVAFVVGAGGTLLLGTGRALLLGARGVLLLVAGGALLLGAGAAGRALLHGAGGAPLRRLRPASFLHLDPELDLDVHDLVEIEIHGGRLRGKGAGGCGSAGM